LRTRSRLTSPRNSVRSRSTLASFAGDEGDHAAGRAHAEVHRGLAAEIGDEGAEAGAPARLGDERRRNRDEVPLDVGDRVAPFGHR
jgi:hypothetical protein